MAIHTRCPWPTLNCDGRLWRNFWSEGRLTLANAAWIARWKCSRDCHIPLIGTQYCRGLPAATDTHERAFCLRKLAHARFQILTFKE